MNEVLSDPTPLQRLIAEMIEQEGPISLERFMDLALYHPTFGYYCAKMPLGAEGDFVTAPEISQMFGELIGLWAAEVWRTMGAPARIALVEFGPGRGTLMADLLRAARAVPAFSAAIEVHLVEANPVLRRVQEQILVGTGYPLIWHESMDMFLSGGEETPVLCIANEFFDCLPLRQFIRGRAGWHERLVGLAAGGGFQFGLAAEAAPELAGIAAEPGAVLEINAGAVSAMHRLATRISRVSGVLLAIDYGHAAPSGRFGGGETLQALRHHRRVDPLEAPGEADLTAHVDFTRLTEAARAGGAEIYGPVTQGEFLCRLGLVERAEALARRANPQQVEALHMAVARLAGDDLPSSGLPGDQGMNIQAGMGTLFKVLAVTAPGFPVPPGF